MGILNINKKLNFFSLWLLVVLLIMVIFSTIPFNNIQRTGFSVYLTFILNSFLWILLLIKEVNKVPFSLMMIHWTFCLIFFFFAAMVQYTNNLFPWGNHFSDDSLVKANIYLTCWTIFIFLGNIIASRKKVEKIRHIKPHYLINILSITLVIMSVLIMIYRLETIGFINLLSRATSKLSYSDYSHVSLLFSEILKAVSYFAVIISFVNRKINNGSVILIIISFISLLISYFPTSLARNTTGIIYFGLLLTLFKTLKNSKIFIILFFSSILIILPFLNAFRNTSFNDVEIIQVFFDIFQHLSDVWLKGDYDAYTMLNVIANWVDTNGTTFGYQLLGVFCFFVPRIWWLSKPIGSGAFVAGNSLWNFTNISCPLPAEGLINFGLVGLIIFALIVGFVAKRLDLLYWKNIDISGENINKFELIYPVLLMCFFFINRGDLLSSTAYTMGFVFIWYITTKILVYK